MSEVLDFIMGYCGVYDFIEEMVCSFDLLEKFVVRFNLFCFGCIDDLVVLLIELFLYF